MLDRIDVKYFKLAVGQDKIGNETEVDIAARCPVCGDSSKKRNSKRLHLYNKGSVTNINCFNGDCSCQNKTVYSFLRDFFPALLEQYKRETFSGTMQKLASGSTADDVFSSFKKEPEPILEETSPVQVQDLSPYLTELKNSELGLSYLTNRGINYDETYGKWYFGHQDLNISDTLYKITNAIVIPLYYKNEMYGFYSRNIYDKTFYTYMNDSNIGYKIWNWFNIDKSKPVYIFEGIFDAISSGFTNVIAAIGAKIPQDRINELSEPIFCYDSDRTGRLNAIDMSQKGHKVFVQPPGYKKDMNENFMAGFDTKKLIQDNLYSGISATIRLKSML